MRGFLFLLVRRSFSQLTSRILQRSKKVQTLAEFRAVAQTHTGVRIPVVHEILADTITPVSAFFRLGGDVRLGFLLESVEGGERLGRYSYIGVDPIRTFSSKDNRITIHDNTSGLVQTFSAVDPIRECELFINASRCASIPSLPRFIGASVGYFGYDMVRYIEHLPNAPVDDLGLADCFFMTMKMVMVFDHVRHTVSVVAFADPSREGVDGSYAIAVESINTTCSLLQGERICEVRAGYGILPSAVSTVSQSEFEYSVRRAKNYIASGDVIQVVLSQRLSVRRTVSAFQLYRALRSVNPSPYLFFLNCGECVLVGASPEMLIRVAGSEIITRPLAGTRRRGATPEEDELLAQELRQDPKEQAEHVMLGDLSRNDLGRVCVPGTVRVTRFMEVERYSTVMHLSSTVEGTMRSTCSQFDAFRATFPIGTLSGAPKVRAMEIIDELEVTRRGPYGGVVGWVNPNGHLDVAIAIRMAVVTKDSVYWQVGAGIVADSDPAREHDECLRKAGGMFRALAYAHNGLEG